MGRLFWKILLGFWLTLVAVAGGTGLWFTLQRAHPPQDAALGALAARTSETVVRSAATTLSLAARMRYRAGWPRLTLTSAAISQCRKTRRQPRRSPRRRPCRRPRPRAVTVERGELLAPQATIRAAAPTDGATGCSTARPSRACPTRATPARRPSC